MTIAIPEAPTPPNRRAPFLFAQRTDELLAWMPGGVAAMNAQNAENNALASAATASAQAAAGHVVTAAAHAAAASTSATAAAALANFKGAWSALSGALNTPASVLHLGQVWMLLNNLANVASAEPGINSASWFAVVTPRRPAIKPSISVDWTLKPTAAALTAAGWTVSRASEMTYFGQAPVKVAENLFQNSRNFLTAWSKEFATVSAVTDESGLVGVSLVASTSNNWHTLGGYIDNVNLGAQTYRVSFLLKAGAYTKAFIADFGGRAIVSFNLATGQVINAAGADAGTSASGAGNGYGPGYIGHRITPHELGGGLYWCSVVLVSGAAGSTWSPIVSGLPSSKVVANANDIQFTGDGVSGIEVYAAQLQHDFDGDFVETTTTPVTLYASPLLTAPANELAYQHNADGECMGLLSYPTATNLCLQSQNLGHASWLVTAASVALSKRLWAGTAPFYRIAKSDSSQSAGIRQVISQAFAAGSTFSMTLAVMGDYWSNTTNVGLAIGADGGNPAWGTAAESTVAILSGPGTLSRSSDAVPWLLSGLSTSVPTLVRITRTISLAATSITPRIQPGYFSSTTPGAAILATRVQLEAGPRATPYIPTTTAAVTRTAQSVTLAGSGFAAVNNPAQGTLLTRAAVEEAVWDGTRFAVQLDHSAAPTAFRSGLATSAATSTLNATTQNRNADQAAVATLANVWGTAPSTVAYSYLLNGFQAAANGVATAVDTLGVVPAVNRLVPGGVSGATGWAGVIQRTELYPRAMTAAELTAITTPGVLV